MSNHLGTLSAAALGSNTDAPKRPVDSVIVKPGVCHKVDPVEDFLAVYLSRCTARQATLNRAICSGHY